MPADGPLSREKLRDLRSLDSVKIRRRKGLCIVEGERSLREAFRTGSLLYLVASGEDHAGRGSPDDEGPWPGVPRYSLDRADFKDLTDVRSGIGLLGVARIPAREDLESLIGLSGRACLFYLDGIQEPGNVGALIRTAWALGFAGVLLGEGTADPFSSKAVRASAGGVFHMPLYSHAGAREVRGLVADGYALFAADRTGEDYRSIDFPDRAILALGNEAGGFSGWVLEEATVVGIPLAEGVDSLNVVVAGGIIASRMVD